MIHKSAIYNILHAAFKLSLWPPLAVVGAAFGLLSMVTDIQAATAYAGQSQPQDEITARLQADASVATYQAHYTDTQIKSHISAIDSMIRSVENGDLMLKADLLCQKARIYKNKNYYSTAISLYDQALELLEGQTATEERRIEILLEQSELFEPQGDYSGGMERLYRLLKIAQNDHAAQRAMAYINLGHYYGLVKNRPMAKEYLDSADNILRHLPISDSEEGDGLLYKLHNTIAGFYAFHNLDSAFLHLQLAEEYADHDINKMQVIYQNKAVLYSNRKDYNTAETYFQKALVLIDDEFQRLYVLYNIAELEYLKGRYEASLALFEQTLAKAEKLSVPQVKVAALKSLADIHARLKHFETSYQMLLAAQTLADSTDFSQNRKDILALQRDFELFKAENEKRLYDYKTEVNTLQIFKKNVLIVLLSLGLAIIIVCGSVLYRNLRRQRSRSKQLSDLLELKTIEERKNLDNIRGEADKKSRELVSNTLFLAKAGETMADVLPKLKELRVYTKHPTAQHLLNSIENEIQALHLDTKQRDMMRVYFDEVHPAFFSNLNQAFPTLTAGENRICAFIVMNMTTKDIATLTNRSPRTIDTIKFRIRRKMNIPKDVSTLSFLLPFTHAPMPEK